jgi:hypothetical protein
MITAAVVFTIIITTIAGAKSCALRRCRAADLSPFP